jgi:tight adherence protein B
MEASSLILFVGGGLGLLLLVVGVASTVLSGRSVVEERLGRYSESGGMVSASSMQQATAKVKRSTPMADWLNRLGEGTDLFDGISKNLARADIKLRPAEYMVVMVAVSLGLGAVLAILARTLVFGIVGLVVGVFVPGIYVSQAQKKRLRKFDDQLGDMLNLTVNGLRAGYSTLQAMEAVSRELPPPICDEFRRVVQEMQLGLTMEDSLDHILRRIRSDDLDLVVTAINVQREVGGNLAEILDVISYTIRERVRIKGEINSLTAQGRATAWVISGLPLALMAILFIVNRPYMMEFINPDTRNCGIPMLCLGGGMIGSGFYIVQRMVKIDI